MGVCIMEISEANGADYLGVRAGGGGGFADYNSQSATFSAGTYNVWGYANGGRGALTASW